LLNYSGYLKLMVSLQRELSYFMQISIFQPN